MCVVCFSFEKIPASLTIWKVNLKGCLTQTRPLTAFTEAVGPAPVETWRAAATQCASV